MFLFFLLLTSLVHPLPCLQDKPSFAADALQQLSGVARFSMLAAMLPKSDKAVVREVLNAVEAAGSDKAAVQSLAAKYRV